MTNLSGDDLERYERRAELEPQIAAGGEGANMTWLQEALQVAIGAQATELGRLTSDIAKRDHKLGRLRKDLAKVELEREALLVAPKDANTVPSTPKIDYQAIEASLSDAAPKIKRLKTKLYWAETWEKEHSATALSRLATLVAHTAADPQATAIPMPKTAAYRALTKGQRKAARRAYMPTALDNARKLLRQKGYATGTSGTIECHVGDSHSNDLSSDDSSGASGSDHDVPSNGSAKFSECNDTPPIMTVKLEEVECARTNLLHTAQRGHFSGAPTNMALPASHIVIGDDKMQVTLPNPDQPYVWTDKKRVMVNGGPRDICVEVAVSIHEPSSVHNPEPGFDGVKCEAEVMAADHHCKRLAQRGAKRKHQAAENKAPTKKQKQKLTKKKQKQKQKQQETGKGGEGSKGSKGVKALQAKKEHE